MTTHPYVPLYVDDYEAATAHLTLEEDGVYNRLLRLCWRTPGCSLPDDAAWIARKIRLSPENYDRIAKPVIEEFFIKRRSRLRSPSLDAWSIRVTAREKRQRRGVRRWLRAFILERDRFICGYCGTTDGPFHVDHVSPASRGGTDAPENLVCACERCNLTKGARTVEEWRAG